MLFSHQTIPYMSPHRRATWTLSGRLLRLKPEFVKQVNEDGFSPIHIASANGHLEIVRELLRVDQGLCRIEGRNKWTPLHFAASRGWPNLVKEMLLVCPQSLQDVTVHKETSLHLAIKNSQFEAVDVMLAWIREKKRDDVLNMRDQFGNSVLHLATWRKHHQVVEWLIGFGTTTTTTDGTTTTTAALIVNAVNNSNLTALDLLHMFPSEAGDIEIHELLHKAGAKRSNDITHDLFSSNSLTNDTNNNNHHHHQQQQDMVEYFKFKMGRDPPSDALGALLVMAVLIATATFQAGINPPSGIWQDSNLRKGDNTTTPIHLAGSSILGSYSPVSYIFFVIFNSTGLSVSLYMLTILTNNLPMRVEFQICVTCLYVTYYTALNNMAPPDGTRVVAIVVSTVVPASTHLLVKLITLIIIKIKLALSFVLKY
ncbi:hypothetical protein CsatB_009018 [Cannabis sativa]